MISQWKEEGNEKDDVGISADDNCTLVNNFSTSGVGDNVGEDGDDRGDEDNKCDGCKWGDWGKKHDEYDDQARIDQNVHNIMCNLVVLKSDHSYTSNSVNFMFLLF